jgi:hypothetical protein
VQSDLPDRTVGGRAGRPGRAPRRHLLTGGSLTSTQVNARRSQVPRYHVPASTVTRIVPSRRPLM